MNCTIDASVFVAAARDQEAQYQVSLEFLDQIQAQGAVVLCPSLVLAECAAAIVRPTGDVTLAEKLVTLVETFPGLNLISLTSSLARRAAQIAISQQLRGADAIYVAVAEVSGAHLVTWDGEMLARGAGVVPVSTPQAWLESQTDES